MDVDYQQPTEEAESKDEQGREAATEEMDISPSKQENPMEAEVPEEKLSIRATDVVDKPKREKANRKNPVEQLKYDNDRREKAEQLKLKRKANERLKNL